MRHRVLAVLIGGLAAFASAQIASAADLPRKAPVFTPPPPAPLFGWTGFYVGVNGGYAWGRSDVSTTVGSAGTYFVPDDVTQIAAAGAATLRPDGGTGGIQAGYNWQGGNFVLGVEADFNALALKASRSITVEYLSALGTFFTINQSIETRWLFTARPRIGWAMDNWLLYVTGGLAVTELKYGGTFTDTFAAAFQNGSISKTKAGWVIGGGVEYGLTRNWSVKAEYLYVDFGGVSSTGVVSETGGGSDALNHSANLTASIARAGINYRFN